MHSSCDTLSSTSADAIEAVNAYVSAYNEEGGDVESTESPAVDALIRSAEAVDASISDVMPPELVDALAGWVDGARSTAEAISSRVAPSEFNQVIGDLNDARSVASTLCDATY
jgi:K+-transporting ATPase c subunit